MGPWFSPHVGTTSARRFARYYRIKTRSVSAQARETIRFSAENGLFQIEPEGMAFHRRFAGPEALDGADHAAVALQQPVGDRDDAQVRLRRRRGDANGARDPRLLALRIERAGGGEGRRRRA